MAPNAPINDHRIMGITPNGPKPYGTATDDLVTSISTRLARAETTAATMPIFHKAQGSRDMSDSVITLAYNKSSVISNHSTVIKCLDATGVEAQLRQNLPSMFANGRNRAQAWLEA